MKTVVEIENKGRELQKRYDELEKIIDTKRDAAIKSNVKGEDARVMWREIDELKAEYKQLRKEIQNYPFVGQKVTVVYYSDKRGGVITDVKGNKFRVEELAYKQADPYQGDCTVSDDKTGYELGWFSVRKCGICYEVGSAATWGNVYCILGDAVTYIDPNF